MLLWNIRGMGKEARVRQLKELISKEKIDIVGIQETIKKNFSNNELKGFTKGSLYLELDSCLWTFRRYLSGGQR
jgi:exonuclease III